MMGRPPPFTGSLDGDGYVISDLTVNIDDTGIQYGGLFGYIDGAVISKLGLTDSNITVTATGDIAYAGGLAGWNDGTISNSFATGGSVVSTSDKVPYAGGLAGWNDGTISNSFATGRVYSESSALKGNSYGGGLAGRNEYGTITNSYATGNVSSTTSSDAYAGGLAGRNTKTISNSYATGNVSSHGGAGSFSSGLAGWNVGGTISNSYAAGSAGCITTGPECTTSFFGGLVGYLAGGTISDSYWDTDTGTGLTVSCGGKASGTCLNASMFGLMTTEMQSSGPSGLGDAFQLGDGDEYPKVKKCVIDTMTNVCDATAMPLFSDLVPGQE